MMKALFSIFIGVLFAFFIYSPGVSAQDPTPKLINGGVLNGKAISLPKPEYPVLAREAGIGGVVGVNVTIDESGLVVFAEADLNDQRERKAEDGTKHEPVPVDPSLREAAENAARLARFSPICCPPIKFKGKILYNFVAGKSDAANIPKTVSGGVLNGRALSLPPPEYPAAAKAINAQGMVSVSIAIDEGGNVTSATAVSGHPLLRSASVAAAREAKFLPTLLDNQPVKVAGILTYNFVLPKKDDQ